MSQAQDVRRESNIIWLVDLGRSESDPDPPPRPAAAARKPIPMLDIDAVGWRTSAPPACVLAA